MDAGLTIAVLLALAFAATNGLHDASNAIATLVATRAARPSQAIVLATVFNLIGPLLLGAAVADTIGGIVDGVTVRGHRGDRIRARCGVAWNLATWRLGLPSSSGHALVGGLVGAAVVEGGIHAVNWGGMDGRHPIGVFGTLIALAVSPVLGAWSRCSRSGSSDAPHARHPALARHRPGRQWVTAAALSFSHGANDAQKSVGVWLRSSSPTDGSRSSRRRRGSSSPAPWR